MKTRPLAYPDLHAINRRLPHHVKEAMIAHPDELILAGGALRAIIRGDEPIHDIDLFPASLDVAQRVLAHFDGKLPDVRKHASVNAVTYLTRPLVTQVVTRWAYPDAASCIEHFDFTVAQAAVWYHRGGGIAGICSEAFYPDLAARRLVYTHPQREEEPGGSMLRLLKFTRRGYIAPLSTVAALVVRVAEGVKDWGEADSHRRAFVVQGLLKDVDPRAFMDTEAIDSDEEESPKPGTADPDPLDGDL